MGDGSRGGAKGAKRGSLDRINTMLRMKGDGWDGQDEREGDRVSPEAAVEASAMVAQASRLLPSCGCG